MHLKNYYLPSKGKSILHQHDQYISIKKFSFYQQTTHYTAKLLFIQEKYGREVYIAFLKRFHISQFQQIKL